VTEAELADLLALARDAASAGAAVLERSAAHVTGRRVAYLEKGSPIDLVTEIDRESEHAILAVLRRGAVPVIAEEGGREGEANRSVFYVDPLDGTTNYAHGHPFHCVSIGLVVDGLAELGVVHAPMLGVVWSGGRRLGATRRDLFRGHEHPLAVSTVPTLDAALGATGFPYDRCTSEDDNVNAFGALTKRTHGVLRCGSAALDLALVADGTYDLFWERKLKPWDLAAGAALVVAAGGRTSDPWGGPFVAEAGAVAASNGLLHEALLRALERHQPARGAR
jgi:myo-inositol-1(or 4)-monophosphatase